MEGSNHITRLTPTLRVVLVGLLAVLMGCSRENFRIRADKDVEAVISQKNLFPNWQVQNWHVYPDPRARYADSSSPDYPAYPPDDYATWLTSPNPQKPGRGGTGRYEGEAYIQMIAAWDAQNRAEDKADRASEDGGSGDSGKDAPAPTMPTPDNPAAGEEFALIAGGASLYLKAFESTQPAYRIRLEQAVELAILNAREFQDRREDLYLAALPVTLERYSFAAQALAAEQVIRQSTLRDYTGGAGEQWQINTDPSITRRFGTGAELMVKLANQIVVDLSGPKPQTSLSNLTLTFMQPLLRGGGYAVTLEALTQAERTLLYAIRSFARFRKVFYVAIAGQGNYTNNPYGLQGLAANLGRGIGANLTANPNGYLPTILRAATLGNQRRNVANLEQLLRLFQNLKEGGGVSDLQVTRVEQNLIRGRTDVLTSTRLYLDNLDFFKLQLGVPTTLPLELDDGPLRPVRRQLQRFDSVYAALQDLEKEAGRYDPALPAGEYRQRWARLLTESSLARGTPFAEQYPGTAQDLARRTSDDLNAQIANLLERRRILLDQRVDRQLKNVPDSEEQIRALDAVDSAVDRIRFELALRRYEGQPWLRLPADRRAVDQALSFKQTYETGILVAIQVRNQRLDRIRAAWPALPALMVDGVDLLQLPLDDGYTKIAQTALINRFDLMNARAQVVDGWRQLTVRANALRGTFDVQYDLSTLSPTDEANGLNLGGLRTRNTVTLRFDPPFVRRAERNQYRTALISYQRSRRNLMAFEDNILVDARQDYRQLRQLSESYRLQQRAVELAYSQVDNARSTFVAPPDPLARDSAGAVAALTQQLLEAQSSLLQAQNDLFTTWVNYLAVRMEMFLDLELLPLDARGLWIDEASISPPNNPVVPAVPVERLPAPQVVPAPPEAKP